MLGSAYVFGRKKHFAIEFILEKLSKKKALIMSVLIEIVILSFAIIVMVIGGSRTVLITMAQSSAGLGIPMGYVYLSLPVSGILIIGYSLLSLIEMKNKPNVDLYTDDLEVSFEKLKSKILE
jgi:TRAP-type C4-dicarboxylate transport system permease small subunit